MRVLLAIPSYRCSAQIGRVLRRLPRELRARIEHIAIIDNRSDDATCDVALNAIRTEGLESIAAVYRNRDNYGLGGSHKVAFGMALAGKYDYVAILHGDDQGRGEELARLFDEARAHPDAMAILGARFMPASKLEGYSKLRIAGNVGLNLLYTLLSGRMTWDMGSGLNLFRVADLKNGDYLRASNAFTFNMDWLLAAYRRRAKLRFVPITWTETDQVSNARTFRVGWIALKTLLNWRFLPPPAEARQNIAYHCDRLDL